MIQSRVLVPLIVGIGGFLTACARSQRQETLPRSKPARPETLQTPQPTEIIDEFGTNFHLFKEVIGRLSGKEITPEDQARLALGKALSRHDEAYMADRLRAILRSGIDRALAISRENSAENFENALSQELPFLVIGPVSSSPFGRIDRECTDCGLGAFFRSALIFKGLVPEPDSFEKLMNPGGYIGFPVLKRSTQTTGYRYVWRSSQDGRELLVLQGDGERATLRTEHGTLRLQSDSGLAGLTLFYETLWDAIVAQHGAEFSHRQLTHPSPLSEILNDTKATPLKTGPDLSLEERHPGKTTLGLLSGGLPLDQPFEVSGPDPSTKITLADLKAAYQRNIGYSEEAGIYYIYAEPQRPKAYFMGGGPVDPEYDFGWVLVFLWKSSTPEERQKPFQGKDGRTHTIQEIAEETFKLAAQNPHPFETVEDNLHIPMFAIPYFAERRDRESLDGLKKILLKKLEGVLSGVGLIEYKSSGAFGRVGHYTEWLGELADCPLVTWLPEDRETIQRWIQEIAIATPRGFPETSGEMAHLVKGLKMLARNRGRVGL